MRLSCLNLTAPPAILSGLDGSGLKCQKVAFYEVGIVIPES